MPLFLPSSTFQVTRLLTNAGCDLSKVWLGGNSLAEEDHWVWPDGSKVSDATMWGPGQPGRGECMVLVDSKWQAAKCLDSRSVKSFLASHQLPKPTRPTTPPPPPPTPTSKRTTAGDLEETTNPGLPQTPSR